MQKAAAESARMAAKETSVAMSANDRPVDVDDDLFD